MQHVTVEGRSGYLIVPIVLIAICAIAAPLYFEDHLPAFCVENASKVLTVVALVEAALCAAGIFLSSRRLHFDGHTIAYVSAFRRRTVEARRLTHVTMQQDVSSGSGDTHLVSHYVTLWDALGERIRLNVDYWDRAGMRLLLAELARCNPDVVFAREIQAVLGDVAPRRW